MPIELPITRGETSNFVIELDGAFYRLRFYWLPRMQCYLADIGTQANEAIQSGCRVTSDFPLFANRVDARMPPGRFLVEDTRPEPADPEIGDLGQLDDDASVRVLYYPAEE